MLACFRKFVLTEMEADLETQPRIFERLEMQDHLVNLPKRFEGNC